MDSMKLAKSLPEATRNKLTKTKTGAASFANK